MPRVFLASKSPRRRKLLTEHGIDHEVITSGLDDGGLEPGAVTPQGWVAALAFLKAAAAVPVIARHIKHPGEAVVIGADTIVLKGGRLIGQPRSAEHAVEILRTIENGSHEVLTGVCLMDPFTRRREFFVDTALVRVGDIGGERIGAYVASGHWVGKAGAYNLAERLADGWPIDFEGDPTTIMGLPMMMLPGRLLRFANANANATGSVRVGSDPVPGEGDAARV